MAGRQLTVSIGDLIAAARIKTEWRERAEMPEACAHVALTKEGIVMRLWREIQNAPDWFVEFVMIHELSHVAFSHFSRHAPGCEDETCTGHCVPPELWECEANLVLESSGRAEEFYAHYAQIFGLDAKPKIYTYSAMNLPHLAPELLCDMVEQQEGRCPECGGVIVEDGADLDKARAVAKAAGEILAKRGLPGKGIGGRWQTVESLPEDLWSSRIVARLLEVMDQREAELKPLLPNMRRMENGLLPGPFLGLDPWPQTLWVAVDVSGSMQDRLLIKSVKAALDALASILDIKIVAFSGAVIYERDWDGRLEADWGGTCIDAAADYIRDRKGPKVLVSDLEDTYKAESRAVFDVIVTEENGMITID